MERFGHAACLMNDKLVIVGGSRMYQPLAKIRECLSDILIYYPHENQWQKVKYKGFMRPRRSHIACIIGKHLVLSGGIDSMEVYLSDTIFLNIESRNEKAWAGVEAEGESPGNIAYHACHLITFRKEYVPTTNYGIYYYPIEKKVYKFINK